MGRAVPMPADGYVTFTTSTVGDRAMQFHSAMSFIVTDGIRIIGMFSPNGFQTIKPGAPIILVFDNDPSRLYPPEHSKSPGEKSGAYLSGRNSTMLVYVGIGPAATAS